MPFTRGRKTNYRQKPPSHSFGYFENVFGFTHDDDMIALFKKVIGGGGHGKFFAVFDRDNVDLILFANVYLYDALPHPIG